MKISFYLKLPAVQWESSAGVRTGTVNALREAVQGLPGISSLCRQWGKAFLRKAFHTCILVYLVTLVAFCRESWDKDENLH